MALIWVDRAGQNSIVVASGANHELAAADVEAMRRGFPRRVAGAIPTGNAAGHGCGARCSLARAEGLRTILDPAPAQPLPRELLPGGRYPDAERERGAHACWAGRPARVSPEMRPSWRRRWQGLGPRTVILKLGDQGCFPWRAASPGRFPVEVRDTTAAGDTFNAALAVALAEDKPMPDAIRFANAAAAISVYQDRSAGVGSDTYGSGSPAVSARFPQHHSFWG